MILSKLATVVALIAMTQPVLAMDCTVQANSDTPASANLSQSDYAKQSAAQLAQWLSLYDYTLQIYQAQSPHDIRISKGTALTVSFESSTQQQIHQSVQLTQDVDLSTQFSDMTMPAIPITADMLELDGTEPGLRVTVEAPAVVTSAGALLGHILNGLSKLLREGTMVWGATAEIPLGSTLDTMKAAYLTNHQLPLPANFQNDSTMFIAPSEGGDHDLTVFVITRKVKDPVALAKLAANFKVGEQVISNNNIFQINSIDSTSGLMQVKNVSKFGIQSPMLLPLEATEALNQDLGSNPYRIGDKVLSVYTPYDNNGNAQPQVSSDLSDVIGLSQDSVELGPDASLSTLTQVKALRPVPTLCGLNLGDTIGLANSFFTESGNFKVKKSDAESAKATYVHDAITEGEKCRGTVAQIDDSGFAQINWNVSSCDLKSLIGLDDESNPQTPTWIHISVLNKVTQ